jgi:threonine dehydratase
VLDVEHHRSGIRRDIAEVEVLLTVETRDPDHRGEVVDGLRRRGFTVELER